MAKLNSPKSYHFLKNNGCKISYSPNLFFHVETPDENDWLIQERELNWILANHDLQGKDDFEYLLDEFGLLWFNEYLKSTRKNETTN